MEELLTQLVSKVGLSEDQAKQVVAFLQENADKIPGWLGQAGLEGVADKLPGGLGGLLGGGD